MIFKSSNQIIQYPALTITLTLTFDLSTQTISLIGYLKVIPYIKFEHDRIIRFWVILRTVVIQTLTLTFDL